MSRVLTSTDRQQLADFLTRRLTEELGRLWARDRSRRGPEGRPGLASQVAVLDDLLGVLAAGRLPERHDLVVLLVGYRDHPDFDARWAHL